MRQLPPALEKILRSLGLNTNRLMWKLHYAEEAWRRRRAATTRKSKARRYKACRRCGELALAEDKVCKCGRKLPSYLGYRLSRALAFDRPEFALVSSGFLFVILALFAAEVMVDGARALMNPSTAAFLAFGGFNGALFESGQYWRAFSMALGHIGVIHVAFNTIAISQMLPRFEEEIGPWRALILITLTQVGAVAGHLLYYEPHVFSAGASGVAFGLIGFGLAYAHRSGNTALRGFFIHWCVYGLAFGVMIGANNAAHVGGFIVGLPLGYWMAGREPRGALKNLITAAGSLCLAVWIVAIARLVVSVLRYTADGSM